MQDRGAPPAGLMSQAPDHRVTYDALAPALSAPPVLTSNTARQHSMVWPNALAHHLQPQVIQACERAQIRAIKGSIGHVEVFRMDGVGISIIGRPRPLPGHDTPNPAHNTYTLNYEEPPNGKRKLALVLLCSLAHGHECGEREGAVRLDVPAIEVTDGGGKDALRVE